MDSDASEGWRHRAAARSGMSASGAGAAATGSLSATGRPFRLTVGRYNCHPDSTGTRDLRAGRLLESMAGSRCVQIRMGCMADEKRARLLVFVVAYHAEKTIEKVLTRIPQSLSADYDVEILAMDDASRDSTF